LNQSISSISSITESINHIKIATDEINAAMEASGKDAERLSDMTRFIHKNSVESKDIAAKITEVDEKLEKVNKGTVEGLKNTVHSLSNNDILRILDQASESHIHWLDRLKSIVGEGELKPLQTDDHKCKFGHYYHSMNITYPTIKKDWQSIDEYHHKLHITGEKTINLVKGGKTEEAMEACKLCEEYGQHVLNLIKSVRKGIVEAQNANIEIFR